MSTEENKALVRHFTELENQGDIDGLFELLAPGYVSHYTTGDNSVEQLKEIWPNLGAAFPDIHFTITHIVTEGDMVSVREVWTGTHKGEFMAIPPTGKKVKMINTCIIRIADGKYAESWCTLDEFNLMQQLGVIPKQ